MIAWNISMELQSSHFNENTLTQLPTEEETESKQISTQEPLPTKYNSYFRSGLIFFVALICTTAIYFLIFYDKASIGSNRLSNISMQPIQSDSPAVVDDVVLNNLVYSQNMLGFPLLHQLGIKQPITNIAISFTSISQAIGMTYLGAEGETKSAIENTLNITNFPIDLFTIANAQILSKKIEQQDGVIITSANSIWGNNRLPLDTSYIESVKTGFKAESFMVDFSDSDMAENQVNSWVNDKTKGKISKIVQNLPADTVAILANAVYFKGLWTTPFDPGLTKTSSFTLNNGKVIEIPTMYQEQDYRYLETPTFQLIRLPYGSSKVYRYSMYILLPKQSISSFMDQLTEKNWNDWMERTGDNIQEGTLRLPRFKITFNTSLKDSLTSLGMGIAFTRQADFSRMISSDKFAPYYISDVVHSTTIEVDEAGTEAAAATAVIPVSGGGGEPPPPFSMNVNKPFIFAVCDDQTNEIYFAGIVNDPRSQN